MTKLELVQKIAEKLKKPHKEVEPIVDQVIREAYQALCRGEKVYLSPLGIFHVKARKGKQVRNLQLNKQMYNPPHHVPTYRPSRKLAQKVKQNSRDQDWQRLLSKPS